MEKPMKGRTFYRLTVIGERVSKNGRSYWPCRCSCGKETLVEDWHLKNGYTKSCGCYRKELPSKRRLDLTGERYGRLTVEGPAKDCSTGLWWICRCDCGNVCVCHKERLRSGLTRSCGCLQNEQRRANMENSLHFVDGTCIERISSRRKSSNNTSGQRGVYRRENGKWRAVIGFQGNVINLGTFEDFDDAVKARKEAEEKIYGGFLEKYRNSAN